LTRRAVLAGAASTAALWAAGARPRAGCQTNAWAIGDFKDLVGVIAKLKALGYEGYETGFRNVQTFFDQSASAATAREQLAKAELAFVNIHIFMEQYDPQTCTVPADLIARVAKGGAALGAQCLVVSGVPCADAGKKAAALDRAGRVCRDAELRFAYHNHGPEFTGKEPEIEKLIAATDPALTGFVIDAGHAFRAGADVAAFFARHSAGIQGMHLRDFRSGEQVVLGEGSFDLKPLAAAVKQAAWSGWLINEEERLSGEKLGDSAVGPARRYMKSVFGV
jgi:sugar phosphate isomerase/epimerase